MATLSPPQPNRARSSSIVQPLTIDSLRRTPGTVQCSLPLDAPPTPITPSNQADLPWANSSPCLSTACSRPPGPRPSANTHPMSAHSSTLPQVPQLSPHLVPKRTYIAPLVLLTSCFVISLIPIVFALRSLPITSLKSFPRTLNDIQALGKELQAYSSGSSAGMAHVMGVMCCLAVWKHAWSIPGSVVLNVLTGALISPLWATLLMTALTSTGSLIATLLAAPLSPLVQRFVPKALNVVSIALQGSGNEKSAKRTPTWVRLVVMRLIGVVPWSGINIACGVCRVSFVDCAIGAFIGTLPWTAVTCQIGDILQTLAVGSTSTNPQTLSSLLGSPSIVFKLVLLGGSTSSAEKITLSEKEPIPVSPKWKVWRWRRDSVDSRSTSPERRLEEDLDEKALLGGQ
ncbi:Golgi apparatus membrane protein TVP38 [Rhizoctonia solani]|uniref:Golgi apparatus membrane protein TVP38 n=1 Tax=Rhizoctonia solani TaxID=456999 RepID=A0A8H8NP53_9AGAM|nr:Golgi apparatus membrane protein TVP38 [Rhizoctonia solani]QRW15833.1 Golgi apparatus membrane protein TVP38 [Rhizoctonia solani]